MAVWPVWMSRKPCAAVVPAAPGLKQLAAFSLLSVAKVAFHPLLEANVVFFFCFCVLKSAPTYWAMKPRKPAALAPGSAIAAPIGVTPVLERIVLQAVASWDSVVGTLMPALRKIVLL